MDFGSITSALGFGGSLCVIVVVTERGGRILDKLQYEHALGVRGRCPWRVTRACGVHVLRNEFLSFSCSRRPACCPSRMLFVLPSGCQPSTGEFSTPVGGLIEQATSESLVNTDWALNLQICDEVRTSFFMHSRCTCFGPRLAVLYVKVETLV